MLIDEEIDLDIEGDPTYDIYEEETITEGLAYERLECRTPLAEDDIVPYFEAGDQPRREECWTPESTYTCDVEVYYGDELMFVDDPNGTYMR